MSSVILTGDTSGTLTVSAPAVAGSNTITLPAGTGTASLMGSGTSVSASGTSVDFTGIPSWAKKITVMFAGVSTNGSSIVQVQLGYSGGVVTSGYASSAQQSGSGNTGTAGFILDSTVGASNSRNGGFIISNISTNNWVAFGTVTTNAGGVAACGGLSPTLSGTLDRVRITTVNGTDTFDAGSINIMYEG